MNLIYMTLIWCFVMVFIFHIKKYQDALNDSYDSDQKTVMYYTNKSSLESLKKWIITYEYLCWSYIRHERLDDSEMYGHLRNMPRCRGKDKMSMDLYIYALSCKSHFHDNHHVYCNNFDTASMLNPYIGMACIQSYQLDDHHLGSPHNLGCHLKIRFLWKIIQWVMRNWILSPETPSTEGAEDCA